MIEAYLYKIVELLVDIVEANIIILFVGVFSAKEKIGEKWKLIFGCAAGMGILCFLMDQAALISMIKTFIVYGGDILICWCIYKQHPVKIVFWSIVYVAVFMPMEFLIIYVARNIAGINMETFLMWSMERAVVLVIIKIIEIVIVYGCYQLQQKNRTVQVHKKMMLVTTVMLLFIIGMVLLFAVNCLTGKYVIIVTLSYLSFSICAVVVLIYFMFVITTGIEQQQRLELMQLQNEMLQQSLEETKNNYMHWEKSIHDYKNTIVCLNSMLDDSDNVSLREYLNKEMEHIQNKQHIVNCGNFMLNSILSMKWGLADSKQIYFSIQGRVKEKLPIPEIQMGRLVGNLIDNAIEGAVCSENKPYVEVILNQTEDIFMLDIVNSATDEKIEFTKSTKKNGNMHGIGLQSIREIVEENGGAFEITQRENAVMAKVEFYIGKES